MDVTIAGLVSLVQFADSDTHTLHHASPPVRSVAWTQGNGI
jgi:hypothetical protein